MYVIHVCITTYISVPDHKKIIIMVEQEISAMVSLYGTDWQEKQKDATSMASTSSKRTPGGGLRDGDHIVFFEEFSVMDDSFMNGKTPQPYESFPIFRNGNAAKLSVGALANIGYSCFLADTEEEVAKAIAARDAGETVAANGVSGNIGSVVEAWQNAGTQDKAIEAVASGEAIVSLAGYYACSWDTEPRKRWRIDWVEDEPAPKPAPRNRRASNK